MKEDNKSEAARLRQKAEEQLKKKPSKSGSQLSEDETLKLYHELEVHQIELELLNEELMLAKAQAAKVTDQKYAELYDFAPSGYFTLSRKGKIIELNLCGSQMLGKERLYLKNSSFGFFVSNDTKPIFNIFLGKIFKSKAKGTCEVTLSANGNLPMYVHLDGIAAENGEQCLVTVVDITEHRRAAENLRRKDEHYRAVIENIFRFVPEGLLVFTRKLNLMKQNKAFEEIVRKYAERLGYTQEELAEKIIGQLCGRITSGDTTEIRIPGKDQ